MIRLVTGPPSSGRSFLAEKLAEGLSCGELYYIATMKVMDEEGRKRVIKHRKEREGAGFVTLEIESDIEAAIKAMDKPQRSVALLECVANLVGNMMHDIPDLAALCRSGPEGEEGFAKAVTERIRALSDGIGELVAVTCEYEPGALDDEDTRLYKKLLGLVNIKLRAVAEEIYDSRDPNVDGGRI